MMLKIISPEKTLYSSENTRSVICPGIDGSFQLLNNHSAMVSALKKGEITVKTTDNEELKFNIASGLAECSNNIVNLLIEEI